jgi:hypothetical protein
VGTGKNQKTVNTTIMGPFLDVRSISIVLTGGGGGMSSGSASVVLNELRIVGSGAWGG